MDTRVAGSLRIEPGDGSCRRRGCWRLGVLVIALVLGGCGVFSPARQAPEIQLTSIKPLPRQGLEQRFLVGLKIVNPNRSDLNISGMSYGLSLNGQKVASGVSGQLVAIPGYSESRLVLEASTNLISGLRLVAGILQRPEPVVDYEFTTRLRVAWWPVPLTIVETGTIGLGNTGIQSGGR